MAVSQYSQALSECQETVQQGVQIKASVASAADSAAADSESDQQGLQRMHTECAAWTYACLSAIFGHLRSIKGADADHVQPCYPHATEADFYYQS
jgi:hypothetical protein